MAVRRRKRRINLGSKSRNKDNLIVFLSLVVLIETLLILFLLPRTTKESGQTQARKKRVSISEKKVKEARSVPLVALPSKKIAKIKTPDFAPKPLEVPEKKKVTPAKVKGKIAIVIDDWGYNMQNLSLLKDIDAPLTLAILPFLNYSREIADFAKQHNIEVIIHMPMEPKGEKKINWEANTLTISMREKEIINILEDAFRTIPYAKGMNNHMGSLATENERLMNIVFAQLRKKNMFFLDSLVTANSVCKNIAQKNKIRFTERSVFLDNSSDPAYISGQLMELASEAEAKGSAIGIGHDKRNTLLVLKEIIPQLEREGYSFVAVSDLLDQ